MIDSDKIAQLAVRLYEIAKPVYESIEYQRWIGAHNADPDQGPSYCFDCCEAEVDKLNVEHPDHDYFMDGGWQSLGDDSPVSCETCQKPLEASLTEWGVKSELEHYSDVCIRLRGAHAPVEAFWLAQMVGSFPELDKKYHPEARKLMRRLNAILNRRNKSRGVELDRGKS